MRFSTIITVSLLAVCAQALSFNDDVSLSTRSIDNQLLEFSTRELVQELEARIYMDTSAESLERRGASKFFRKLKNMVTGGSSGSAGGSTHMPPTDPAATTLERRGKLLRKLAGATLGHVQEKVSGGGSSSSSSAVSAVVERRSDDAMSLERRGNLLRKLAVTAIGHAQEKVTTGGGTTTVVERGLSMDDDELLM